MIRHEWEISVWMIVLVFIILMIAAVFFAHGQEQEIPGYCEGNITWLDREFCGLPPIK